MAPSGSGLLTTSRQSKPNSTPPPFPSGRACTGSACRTSASRRSSSGRRGSAWSPPTATSRVQTAGRVSAQPTGRSTAAVRSATRAAAASRLTCRPYHASASCLQTILTFLLLTLEFYTSRCASIPIYTYNDRTHDLRFDAKCSRFTVSG